MLIHALILFDGEAQKCISNIKYVVYFTNSKKSNTYQIKMIDIARSVAPCVRTSDG